METAEGKVAVTDKVATKTGTVLARNCEAGRVQESSPLRLLRVDLKTG